MNKAAINGRTLPEMTARATSKAARTARKAGAKGASIPYEPLRRGVTRSVIRIALSSRVYLHSDEAAVPHDPTPVSVDPLRAFAAVTVPSHSPIQRARVVHEFPT